MDRSFLYRKQHKDLLAQIHAAEAEPPARPGAGPAVSRTSLKTDLANCQERCARLATQVQQLKKRLSRSLGEQVWRESGLGGPDDIEEDKAALTLQLKERDDDLDAARAANRELLAQLNRHPDQPAGSRPT
ncbi:hypothetical protein MOQ72_27030 [Saccharopolyspora sp. K220]|uniref:hypothetical protein n=1 Tax=Saccharopolyspora soli TaxID=2926618 RepID=UPI001F5ADDA5|nr:hypothetical protein [Saccharopolyspora soli]MCI2421102.1 hypothetical protein [Saccharopolyspora soli]